MSRINGKKTYTTPTSVKVFPVSCVRVQNTRQLTLHYSTAVGLEYCTTTTTVCVCVCVCVFFTFILDIKFVGRTSRGQHRRKVTKEEGHTGFLIYLLSAVRALIFLATRIQPFLSLVDREVEFCVLTM